MQVGKNEERADNLYISLPEDFTFFSINIRASVEKYFKPFCLIKSATQTFVFEPDCSLKDFHCFGETFYKTYSFQNSNFFWSLCAQNFTPSLHPDPMSFKIATLNCEFKNPCLMKYSNNTLFRRQKSAWVEANLFLQNQI